MKKFIKKLWLQKNGRKIPLNDVKFNLYKEFLMLRYKKFKMNSYLSNSKFEQYKFFYLGVTEFYESYYKNIRLTPSLTPFDFFQTTNINFQKYPIAYKYCGSFSLRTRKVSALQHLYCNPTHFVSLSEITDTEKQFQHNYNITLQKTLFVERRKEATLNTIDYSVLSQKSTIPYGKKNLKSIKYWKKINLVRYWNKRWGFTRKQNVKFLHQNRIFSIFKKLKTILNQAKTGLMKRNFDGQLEGTKMSKLKSIFKMQKRLQLKSFLYWMFFVLNERRLKVDENKSLKFLVFFFSILKARSFFKLWKKTYVFKHNFSSYMNLGFFSTLLKMGGVPFKQPNTKIIFRKNKYILFNNIKLHLFFHLCVMGGKGKNYFFGIKNPLLLFYYKLIYLVFKIFRLKKFRHVIKSQILLSKFKRFLFLTKLLFSVNGKVKNKFYFVRKIKRNKVKMLVRFIITKTLDKYNKRNLSISRRLKKQNVIREKKKILNKVRPFLIQRPRKVFRSILNNWDVILNGIAKLKKPAKFKRYVIHILCKSTSLFQFNQMITLVSPFKFMSKNMLKTIWVKEAFIQFQKYKRIKGRSLLTSTMLLRPVLQKIKNLGVPFLKFFTKNPFLKTNEIIPLNLHKLFLNSLKNYFIPLKSREYGKIPYTTYHSSSKRISFVRETLNPIKIIFSPYRQRRRSLQINVLNFKNENLFSSWPGLVIKKISSIVGVHQAHKYTFLIHMKPKKAKKNVMAKSLAIRHASNFVFKYFKKAGGSFEIIVRTTTPVSAKMDDSYAKLLMGFLYKGLKRRKLFDLGKKKKTRLHNFGNLRHLYDRTILRRGKGKFAEKRKSAFLVGKKFKYNKHLLLNQLAKLRDREKNYMLRKKKLDRFRPKYFGAKKKYFLKYVFIFSKYLIILRKMIMMLLVRILCTYNKENLQTLQKAFFSLIKFSHIFKFFIKSTFLRFFVNILHMKKRKLILKKKHSTFHPFHTLTYKLHLGYFRLVKKIYFTQYTVYTKTTHGFPTKKRKNRRL